MDFTLANGEKRIIKPGDMENQRSKLHKWRSPNETEWTRNSGVMVEYQPVVTKSGKTVGPDFPNY